MKTAAIVGADSMLGQALAEQLREQTVDVIRVGRHAHHDMVLDLTKAPGNLPPVDKQVDILFHCAAAFAANDLLGAQLNFQTNAFGCLAVLDLMAALGCRHVVYAGTISSLPEADPSSPMGGSYGLSKAQGEQILDWGMQQVKGRYCSLRLSQLYDIQGRCCVQQSWFGRIIAYASRGLDLRLPHSAGKRNFLHVRDAARLMIRAAEQELSGAWALCHPEQFDYTEIARLAYHEFGQGGQILLDSLKTPFRQIYFPESTALFDCLQIQPQITLSEGLSLIHQAGSADRFGPLDVQ